MGEPDSDSSRRNTPRDIPRRSRRWRTAASALSWSLCPQSTIRIAGPTRPLIPEEQACQTYLALFHGAEASFYGNPIWGVRTDDIGTIWVDGMQLEKGSVPTEFEP